MAVLKLLSTAAWARIVTSGQFFFVYRLPSCFGVLASVLVCGSALCRIRQVIFLFGVPLAALFGCGLAYLLTLYLGYLRSHQHAYDAVVHLVHHVVKQFHALQLEYNQRVFLLVGCVLYTVFQLVECAQILLPAVVDYMQKYGFSNCFTTLLHSVS